MRKSNRLQTGYEGGDEDRRGTGRGREEKERDQLSSFLQVKAEEEQRESFFSF